MGMKIAILGAESTGKSTLAHDLTLALKAAGTQAVTVSEYLREWCDLHQRTPRPDEQAGIAMEQTRRVAAPHGMAVICDTTALMTAIYSDVLFQDITLYTEALADLRTYSHVLVTGLDLPWVEDSYQRDSPAGQQRVHQRLQTVLQEHGIAYSMVWGKGSLRLKAALRIVLPDQMEDEHQAAEQYARWLGQCEKCSDAACEHSLFRSLLAR